MRPCLSKAKRLSSGGTQLSKSLPSRLGNGIYYGTHSVVFLLSSHPYTRITAVLLLTPSNMHVLSTGIYCSVMTLMISCETKPPVRAAILCSSAPPARTSSCTNCPNCVFTAANSSSSTGMPASLTRSSAILKAMPVTFSLSVSTSASDSPGTLGAPAGPSLSCVATNLSQARKAM